MIVTSEYIFDNLEFKETSNIIKNIRNEHEEKYGADIKDKTSIKGEVEYINLFLIEIKVVKINCSPISCHIRKREIASKNRFVVNRIIKLTIIIEKDIKKFLINTYLKTKLLMCVRRFFFNIANNAEFLDIYCDDTNNKLHRAYRQWYLYNRNRSSIITW